MRVTMKAENSPSSCDDGFKGEVEDYLVYFPEAVAEKAFDNSLVPSDDIDPKLVLYPNPAYDMVNFSFEPAVEGDRYVISNSSGMQLHAGSINSSLKQIDISGYAPGIYFVVVHSFKGVFQEKFVKK